MKPRIFINIHYLEIGGAERALLGLLSALDPERVSVDLFVNQHTGEFMPLIPKWVNLLPEVPEYTCIERPIKDIVREGHLDIAMRRLWGKWQHKRYHKRLLPEKQAVDCSVFQFVADAVETSLPSLHYLGEYDLAISFVAPHNIVLNKVRAKKKICWIHTDYSTIHVNQDKELTVWNGYDNIASISEECTKAFLQTFPSLREKIVLIENILSTSFVHQQAKAFDASGETNVEGKDSIAMLSIGRFCQAKNYDNVPDICARIRKQGIDVRWYIIGFGDEEELIRAKIAEAGMEEYVILLGKKDNPYPYIKACDLYVQPSRYEGKSVTVREAQMLCKPVVVTNYPTASSQVHDGVDGVIVPMDNQGCAEGIARVITDSPLREHITQYLHAHNYDNKSEVEKIYGLME